jgi:hypothetical protein
MSTFHKKLFFTTFISLELTRINAAFIRRAPKQQNTPAKKLISSMLHPLFPCGVRLQPLQMLRFTFFVSLFPTCETPNTCSIVFARSNNRERSAKNN